MADQTTRSFEHSLDHGLHLLHQGVDTHLITSHHALPLLIRRPGGLVVEMTDGKGDVNGEYRESVYYDLVKISVIRLAQAQTFELREYGAVAVAVTPGWLRSERMLDKYGVTEANWRAGTAKDPHFCMTESPRYVGPGVAAMAADPRAGRFGGRTLSSADLAAEYDVTDVDGTRPDFARSTRKSRHLATPQEMPDTGKQLHLRFTTRPQKGAGRPLPVRRPVRTDIGQIRAREHQRGGHGQ